MGDRRVAVCRRDIDRALDAARARLGWLRRPQPVAAGAGNPEMLALLDAKARGRERIARERIATPLPPSTPARHATPPPGTSPAPSEAHDLQLVGRSGRPPAGAPGEVAPPAHLDPSAADDDSLAARLRKAREQRR